MFDSIHCRAVRILFKLKRNDITISIHSIMATLGWLKFRNVCKFRLLCITQGYIYGSSVNHIEGTYNSSNYSSDCKCELMKLSVPLVSSIYADAAFTIAAPK